MKSHLWGRERKHGTGHVSRECQRKCGWTMRVQTTRGMTQGKRVRITYHHVSTVVYETPECISEASAT